MIIYLIINFLICFLTFMILIYFEVNFIISVFFSLAMLICFESIYVVYKIVTYNYYFVYDFPNEVNYKSLINYLETNGFVEVFDENRDFNIRKYTKKNINKLIEYIIINEKELTSKLKCYLEKKQKEEKKVYTTLILLLDKKHDYINELYSKPVLKHNLKGSDGVGDLIIVTLIDESRTCSVCKEKWIMPGESLDFLLKKYFKLNKIKEIIQ